MAPKSTILGSPGAQNGVPEGSGGGSWHQVALGSDSGGGFARFWAPLGGGPGAHVGPFWLYFRILFLERFGHRFGTPLGSDFEPNLDPNWGPKSSRKGS